LDKERVAHASTKRDLENAKADASSWQAQSERFERQFLKAADELSALMRLSERLEIELGVSNARWARLKGMLMERHQWDVVAIIEAIEEEIK